MTTSRTTTKATLSEVGKVGVSIRRAMTSLTKEQFFNSRLPGSQFARDPLKPAAQPVSLARLMGMGLLGGLVGYGVSRQGRKSGPAGMASGALLGAGASFAYDRLHTSAEPEVIGALADESGKGSIVLVTDKHFSSASKVMPLFTTKVTALEPPGWAGAIVQHGMLVQAAQMKYVYRHAKFDHPMQVQPYMGYDARGWSNTYMVTGTTVVMEADKMYSNKTLFTERFAEWPSPAWPNYGLGRDGAVLPGTLQQKIADIITRHGTNTRRVRHQGWDQAWRYAITMPSYLANRSPKISDYWTASKMATYNERYSLMVRNAQWFVWAAEMLRIHSTTPLVLDPRWADHCAQWGVGCASPYRVMTKHLMNTYNAQEWCTDTKGSTVNLFGKPSNPLAIKLAPSAVAEYLDLVMKHTPPPFTSDPLHQMNVGPKSRMMMDYPIDFMGSMMPPLDAIGRDFYAALVAKHGLGAPKSMRVFMFIVEAVVEIVATIFGGPGGMVIGAVFSAMTTLAMMAMNNPSQFSKMSTGDICRLVGSMVSQVVSNLGLDIDEFLGDVTGDFSAMLNKMQNAAQESGLEGVLESIGAVYNTMETNLGWSYADEFLGVMQDAGKPVGLGVDDINNAMDRL